MNHSQMIEIIQRHQQGLLIEDRMRGEGYWRTVKEPTWDFSKFDYRLANLTIPQNNIIKAHWRDNKPVELKEKKGNLWQYVGNVNAFNFNHYDYRLKSTLRPYTADEAKVHLLDKFIKHKNPEFGSNLKVYFIHPNEAYVQVKFSSKKCIDNNWSWGCTFEDIFEHYVFMDGSACGLLS